MDWSEEPVQMMDGWQEGGKIPGSCWGAHEQEFHLRRPPPFKMEKLFRPPLFVCYVSDVEPSCSPSMSLPLSFSLSLF